MITITNRLPTKPNRWKVTHESDSSEEYITLEHADEPTTAGTPINKATLEGIQTDLMNETKIVVADVTLSASASAVEINNLDFNADGNFYEIVVILGKSPTNGEPSSILLQANNITSGYKYGSGTSSGTSAEGFMLHFNSSADTDYAMITANITLATQTTAQYMCLSNAMTKRTNWNVSSYYSFLPSEENITKLTLTTTGTFPIGTRIKIVKRR